jgi:uncharacterized membrane protein YidH (DUF202 family)
MKAIVGVVLIVVGVICLVYGGIQYTKREKVIDIGPLKVEADQEKKFPVPPVVGILAIAAGITVLLVRK